MRWLKTIGAVMLAVTLAGGCSNRVQLVDGDEMDHPLMKRAKAKELAGDRAGAEQIYRSLIEKEPSLARGHLGLALLLDKPGGDYVEAIYHYKCYLAMRPDTEKRGMIDGYIHAATLALVGAIYSNQVAVVQRVGVLERENAALQIRSANLDAQLRQSQALVTHWRARAEAVTAEASKTLESRGALEAAIRPALPTVRVAKNDTLRKIAARLYGDEGRWKDLYEANRNLLERPEDVKVGQVLVAPE